MRVTRVRLVLILVLGIVLVMSFGVSPVDAALDEYIATAFTDSSGDWGSEANAYDGDWGTYADDVIFSNGDDYPSAYASGFDSGASGSGTITQVDIIVRMSLTSSSASDEWGITLDVGASTGNVLWAMDKTAYSLNNNTFTDVTEPNGGGWSWAEIQAAEIHLDGEKVGGADNDVWNVYEFAFKVTTSPAGTDYDAFLYDSMTFDDTANLFGSFVQNLFDSTNFDDTANLVMSFIQNLFESIGVAGTTGLIGSFVKSLFESIVFAGTLIPSIILQTFLYDSFVVNGTATIALGYTVLLFGGIVVSETLNIAGVFELSIYESFVVVGNSFAQKITQLFKNIFDSFPITEAVVVVVSSIAGSMFFQLFFSMNMWGYIGPLGLVIIGYFVAKETKNLGIVWFLVECLVIANYLVLVSATPEYWWHILILLIGLFSCLYPLWDG